MSTDTWLHRLAHPAVRPLAGGPITPNHLTTARLATGLGAAAAFAGGPEPWPALGGALFLASVLLDRADGELARLSGTASAFGHRYDLASDVVVTVAVFVAIGVGLGRLEAALGVLAGAAIGAIFWLVERLRSAGGGEPLPGAGGFDPDDALLVVPVCAWLGWLRPLLGLAALVAPLVALALLVRYRAGSGSAGT